MGVIRGRVVIPGRGRGPVLRLDQAISFWGGVDPATSVLIDPRGPEPGTPIAGTVLVLAATRGSSSSSAVLLELLRNGRAPAALVMAEVDAILALGVVVAGEMGWPTIPVLVLSPDDRRRLATGMEVTVAPDGTVAAPA